MREWRPELGLSITARLNMKILTIDVEAPEAEGTFMTKSSSLKLEDGGKEV